VKRGFRHMGGTGSLCSRFCGRLRLDAIADPVGSFALLEVRCDDQTRIRFRLDSLEEWDVWLAAFDRENAA